MALKRLIIVHKLIKKAEEKVDKSRNFKYNISRLAEANLEKCLNNGVHYDVT